jgi:hypothetical protein
MQGTYTRSMCMIAAQDQVAKVSPTVHGRVHFRASTRVCPGVSFRNAARAPRADHTRQDAYNLGQAGPSPTLYDIRGLGA